MPLVQLMNFVPAADIVKRVVEIPAPALRVKFVFKGIVERLKMQTPADPNAIVSQGKPAWVPFAKIP
tara:strand:+ start:337 stop:537 length:201 start_codon:yes stop_codon:yes gene_type:complete